MHTLPPVPLKSQQVRLWDVFVLGPFMLWFGWAAQGVPEWARYAMMIAGITTVAYNGANYLRLSEEGST